MDEHDRQEQGHPGERQAGGVRLPGPADRGNAHRLPVPPVIGGIIGRHDLLRIRRQEHQEGGDGEAGPQAPVVRGQHLEARAVQRRHPLPDRDRVADGGGAEHDVAIDHRDERQDVEGDHPRGARLRQGAAQLAKRLLAPLAPLVPGLVGADIDGVHQAEEHEGPSRAMPDADRHEGHERRHADAGRERRPALQAPLGGPTVQGDRQGLEDIGDDEALQGHVPATPVIGDVGGPKRRMEVERQLDPQHPGQADGHVGVAGEVEIELEGEGDRRQPAAHEGESAALPAFREHGVGVARQGVGDHGLLEEADGEDHQADHQVAPVDAREHAALKLGHHFLVVDDRPGDELGEEGREQREVQELHLLGFAAGAVDQIGDLLEGEERDRQRQHDPRQRTVGVEETEDVVGHEVRVLEPAQQGQVRDQAEDQPGLHPAVSLGLPRALDAIADPVVEDDRAQQQRQVDRIPHRVEAQRRKRQQRLGHVRPAPCRVEQDQDDRQEAEDEREGVEEHSADSGVGRRSTVAAHIARARAQAGLPTTPADTLIRLARAESMDRPCVANSDRVSIFRPAPSTRAFTSSGVSNR